MHTISLKTDDNFFQLLNEMVKDLGTTKSDLIRQAVLNYKKNLEKEKLRQQIKRASLRGREQSLKIEKEFEDTLLDGLDNV